MNVINSAFSVPPHHGNSVLACYLTRSGIVVEPVTWLPWLLLNRTSMARNLAQNKAKDIAVAFGSGQERKMLPTHSAPNRMGNGLLAIHSSPTPGPGCYDNHVLSTIVYNLERRPESKKGYVLAARTSQRFLPSFQTVTPSPQKYQQDWSMSQMCSPGKTPFNSTKPRFKAEPTTSSSNPGPGAYMLDGPCNQRVAWPMQFGSPDWSQVPMLERKALHIELPCEKEFVKHRNRVAYLRLYYS